MLCVMIGIAESNLLATVELLDQNQSHELMRKDKRRKRPKKVGAADESIINTIGAADDNHHMSRAFEAREKMLGEGRGVE